MADRRTAPLLLDMRGLSVAFPRPGGRRGGGATCAAVIAVDLALAAGETLGLVGESGSGKSLSALAALGLTPPRAQVTATRLEIGGRDVRALSPRARRALAGREIAMVFQEPVGSLNPCFTIGFQLKETLRRHHGLRGAALRDRAADLLAQTGIPEPRRRLAAFPHQLSGGLCQRVMIALALAGDPRLLIADEPTTSLDVTIQRQILDLLRRLQAERGMGLLLVSHDVALVGEMADRIAVMYAGQVVESGPAAALLRTPRHPYTAALLAAVPGAADGARLAAIPGQAPALGERPDGCAFHPRCAHVQAACRAVAPPWDETAGTGGVRCHFPLSPSPSPSSPAGGTP